MYWHRREAFRLLNAMVTSTDVPILKSKSVRECNISTALLIVWTKKAEFWHFTCCPIRVFFALSLVKAYLSLAHISLEKYESPATACLSGSKHHAHNTPLLHNQTKSSDVNCVEAVLHQRWRYRSDDLNYLFEDLRSIPHQVWPSWHDETSLNCMIVGYSSEEVSKWCARITLHTVPSISSYAKGEERWEDRPFASLKSIPSMPYLAPNHPSTH